MSDALLVLCYDGSPDAKHAIGRAGVLFPDSGAVVLTVWAPISGAVRSGPRRAAAADADGVAEEGVDIARQAGLRASPLTVEATGPVWKSIIETADSLHAAIIVMGARGSRDLPAAAIGSIAGAVVHRARRPTLIIDRREAALDMNGASRGIAARPLVSVAAS